MDKVTNSLDLSMGLLNALTAEDIDPQVIVKLLSDFRDTLSGHEDSDLDGYLAQYFITRPREIKRPIRFSK